MTLVVPNVQTNLNLQDWLNQTFNFRLYSNNKTPAPGDVASDYVQVSGGGYPGARSLIFANWGFTEADPSVALYNVAIETTFTGAASPNTVYGYYVLDVNGVLAWAERFASTPFVPENGAFISITPRVTGESV